MCNEKDVMRKKYKTLSGDSSKQVKLQDQILLIKSLGFEFHNYLDSLPPSREISLAKTKVEEAIMWAVKAATS